jgi:hypothetical protein
MNSNEMKSEHIGELAKALSQAQSKIEGARIDSDNPFFKSKYATLHSVWKACKDALSTNGLAVCQTIEYLANGNPVLSTTLMHTSGQWVKSLHPILTQKTDPQSFGSAMTYARRYSLAAICGCTPEGDDDDAESAMDRKKVAAPVKVVNQKISGEQALHIEELLAVDPERKTKFLNWANVSNVSDILAKDYERIINVLQQRKAS